MPCPAQMLEATPPIRLWFFFVGARHAVPGADAWRLATYLATLSY